jgi:hypothetical protein
MTKIHDKITVYSEDGDTDYPAQIQITLDGTKPDCPVTFWAEEKAFFSMGNDEIERFCEMLKEMKLE